MNIIAVKNRQTKPPIDLELKASSLILPVAVYEEKNIFLTSDSALGFCFECTPICHFDEKTQERVNSMLTLDVPSKSIMQFILYKSPDIDKQILNLRKLRGKIEDKLLEKSVEERIAYLKKYVDNEYILQGKGVIYEHAKVNDNRLFVTFKMPITNNRPEQSEIEKIQQLKIKFKSSLNMVGMQPVEMTVANYIRCVSTMVNWGQDSFWRDLRNDWDCNKPINEQIFDYTTDIEIGKKHLRLGEKYLKVMSAKRMPELIYFGNAMRYIGDLTGNDFSIKDNFMIVVNLFFPDIEKTRTSLDRKRQFTVNQAFSGLTKFVPVLLNKKESFDILEESLKNGSNPVRLSFSVVIFSDTLERAESSSSILRTTWKDSQFDLMEDVFIALPMFANCLPLCSEANAIKDLFRYKTISTEHAAVLLPILGEWKGTGTPHVSLLSRNGQLMSLSLHDSQTNKNLVIAAESGSGKSFLMNELIISYLSDGAQVWVIDAGKSYQKLAELLGGDFVHFEENSQVSLNPFDLIQNYSDEEDVLVSLILAMASPKGNLDDIQVSGVKRLMGELWQQHKTSDLMTIDDIANSCLQSSEPRIHDIGEQLYSFTTKGGYGRYFKEHNNISFKNNFTVLELDELQGRKHLRQVVLLQLIFQIQQEVFLGQRGRKKIIIVDEAWDLLKEGEIATFIEHAYRKFRKYGGSVVIATQSVNDLYENAVGRAIAENSASIYLLGQTDEAVESIKQSKRLVLSEAGFASLKTIKTIPGVYSEIFIKSNAGIGIGRLIVNEFQKLLYSTSPDDLMQIENLVKQGLTTVQAIDAIIRQRANNSEGY